MTDLILRRLGNDLSSAVKKGLRKPHGPIPRLDSGVRRRMDRTTEKRLQALKDWRGPRAEALKLDPGVLCPNAALEAIAWADPSNVKDLKAIAELKTWFVREFAEEIVGVLERHATAARQSADEAGSDAEAERRPSRSGRRRGRGRSRSKSRAKAAQKSSPRSSGSKKS